MQGLRSVEEAIEYYVSLKDYIPGILRTWRRQYLDMAKGGDGGDLGFERNGERTCRAVNYRGYPDTFFQQVRDKMEWSE